MAVQIMRSDRPAFASGERLEGTQEEIKAAFEGYFAYYGTYEVNEAEICSLTSLRSRSDEKMQHPATERGVAFWTIAWSPLVEH